MLPPNATSIMQALDQGIILSANRRYKKKLTERYLTCVENNKDANSLLKALNIVQATNMIAASWRETSSTIIQNCLHKAGFKHHAVDPASKIEEIPYLLQHQMCGTGCKGGWVTCSLMNLRPVNLKQLQHSLCLIRTL